MTDNLSAGYSQVLVAAPCHKVAVSIYQDIQLVVLGQVEHLAPDDLLSLLHQMANLLREIPEFQRATDMRLRMQNIIEKSRVINK